MSSSTSTERGLVDENDKWRSEWKQTYSIEMEYEVQKKSEDVKHLPKDIFTIGQGQLSGSGDRVASKKPGRNDLPLEYPGRWNDKSADSKKIIIQGSPSYQAPI